MEAGKSSSIQCCDSNVTSSTVMLVFLAIINSEEGTWALDTGYMACRCERQRPSP